MGVSNVIIIGGNHHNTLSLIRCFGHKNIKTILILEAKSSNFVSCSKYVEKTYYCNNDEDILSSLNLIKQSKKLLVICASDHSASLLDLHYEQLKDSFYFANIKEKEGELTVLMDKHKQTELAEKCGFNVPKSWLYNKEIEKYVEFPCLLRPLESIHGGKKIRICNSLEELHQSLKDFSKNDKILIQEYINKESEIVIVGLAVKGKVIIPGYSFKHREISGGTTFSTVYPIENLNYNLAEICERYIKEIGYEGLFGIEFVGKNGYFYFIEINLRNDATCYSVAKAGMNLPYAYWAFCNQQHYTSELSKRITKTNSIVEYTDINNIFFRKISLCQWIKDLKNSDCKYIFDSKDLKPTLKCWWIYCKKITKKITKL